MEAGRRGTHADREGVLGEPCLAFTGACLGEEISGNGRECSSPELSNAGIGFL